MMYVILQECRALTQVSRCPWEGGVGPSQVSGEARTFRLDPGNTPVSNSCVLKAPREEAHSEP